VIALLRPTVLRAASLALAVLLGAAAGDARGDEFRSTGKGLAAGGPVWIGARRAEPARRVVALAPSVTDVLLALGLGDRLVGVTRLDDNAEVARLPRIGGYLDPNPETIVALQPDLVVWVTNASALGPVRRIAELSAVSSKPFPILALQIDDLEDVLATPRVLADELGEPARGERLSREMGAAVETERRRVAGLTPTRVLFVVGREPLIVAGRGSFPDELLRVCRAENVVMGDRPWPVYPLEKAVADDPALVVDGAPLEPAEGIQRLAAIPAVARGAVFRLRNDDLIRPGPRMVRALGELCRAVHPEARR
jgi:iron complex transport system substrate-binding protein